MLDRRAFLALATAFTAAGLRPLRAEQRAITARELTQALFKAEKGSAIDLAGVSLRGLDLAGVDFKAAKLAKADLYGVDLTDAQLTNCDLMGALLDRAIMTRADFSGANLEGATLLRPTIFSGLERNRAEAPKFVGARMAKTALSGWLDGTDFSKADLTGAKFGKQDSDSEGLLASRVRMSGCKFAGAVVRGTDFHGSEMVFADFRGADAAGADFRHVDLTNADFSGANVAGMNVAGAALGGAKFIGAKGFDEIAGLVQALELDRIIKE